MTAAAQVNAYAYTAPAGPGEDAPGSAFARAGRAVPRDALTGAPLRGGPGAVYMVLRDYDVRRPPKRRQPIPTAIDTARPYPTEGALARQVDYLGGLLWGPAFERYLGGEVSAEFDADLRTWHEWWADAYVVGVLVRRFGRYATLLTCARQAGWSAPDLARRFRLSPAQVKRVVARVKRVVRAEIARHEDRAALLAQLHPTLAHALRAPRPTAAEREAERDARRAARRAVGETRADARARAGLAPV